MKKKLTHLLLLFVAMTALSSTVRAQEVPISDWQFSSSTVTIDGARYCLDETHALAEFESYFDDKSSLSETYAVPSKVTYDGKEYTVVSMARKWGGELKGVTKLIIPNTVRRLREYALYDFVDVHEFDIPASVEKIERYLVERENRTLRFHRTEAPEVEGRLSGENKLKLIVPDAGFDSYKEADYIEDCCVLSDNRENHTYRTGTVDNGELGYVVVANLIPKITTYSEVNKLIIEKGTIDETDWYQLRQMKNLVELDISGLSITDIPKNALVDCWQIEKVILNPSLKAIYDYAFQRTGIKELLLPDGLETIDGYRAFYNCDSLQGISIPDGVKSLPSECFRDCDNFTWVKLPSYLETMGSECFYYCDIRDLVIPGTLTTIPYRAFRANTNLETLTIKNGVETIGSEAFFYDTPASVALPPSVRTVKDNAFRDNPKLVRLTLNEGLETIESAAFYNCTALPEVTIPSSLQFCLSSPFQNCTSLKRIYARALIPPTVRNYVPTYQAGNIELYVPYWSFQEYMTTPGWLEYQDHTQIDMSILPENIVINKDFEFVIGEQQNVENYTPNIRMLYNTEEIDDGFGHQKYERGNLIISSRSIMNVKDFSMFVSPFAKYYADKSHHYSSYNNHYDYDAYRTKFSPNSLLVRGQMRAENQTYHLLLENNGWNFISFPFDVKMSDITPDDSKTQWVVRRYDGAERAAQNFSSTWKNLTANDVLESGKGYIMMCYNSDSRHSHGWYTIGEPVEFTLKPMTESVNRQQLFNTSNRTIELEQHPSAFEQNRSWNLIGNPYPCYFDTRFLDTTAPFLVWHMPDATYDAYSPVDDSYILNPGEAFFMQAPVEDGDVLKFLTGGRQIYRNPNDLTVTDGTDPNPSPARRAAIAQQHRTVVNITLQSGESSDRTRVVYNNVAKMDYESGRDAAKFMSDNLLAAQLWTVNAGVQYAINERPEQDGVAQISMRLPVSGRHILAAAPVEGATLYIEDRQMGTMTELTAKGYSFEAEAGTVTGRFFLHTLIGDATGISTVETTAQKSDIIYNLNGQRVAGTQRGLVIKNGKKSFNK